MKLQQDMRAQRTGVAAKKGYLVGALFTDNQSANGRWGKRIKEYVEATELGSQVE